MQSMIARHIHRLVTILLLLGLAGCTTFSPDGGFASVQQTIQDRIGKELRWARSDADREANAMRVRELLQKPLAIDDAVQIALLNNPGLQAAFAELGVSEADLVQAGRLSNPHLTLLRVRHDDDYKIEQVLTFNVFSLITLPMATEMERRRFESVQRAVAVEVLRLAADTRKAWILTVSVEENVRYATQVKTVADASAELARRMLRVGNWSKLSQAREQGFYADAALNLARAVQNQTGTREKLTRLMGLWGEDTHFKLPERLPDLPAIADELPNVEQIALRQRLDVQAVRMEMEATARNLGLTRATRFINALELGPARVLEGKKSDPFKKGYELSLEIPLFDWGSAKVAKAEARYMQSAYRLAEAAINARSEVREAYHGYRLSYDIAKHYRDEIVPIKKRIADENLLRYNGMLIGVFDLLADARSQIASVNGYIDALRDFWLAKADLDMAMIGKPNMTAPSAGPASAAAAPAGH
ncbi:MAG: TolC family protein [Betaproteobacteria bacterium]